MLNCTQSDIQIEESIVKPLDYTNRIVCLLPDVILDWIAELQVPSSKECNGVVLFADVSGFTSLCEKYTAQSQSGINILTMTLNNYIGQVIDILLNHHADIYKFAGDAILCHWLIENTNVEDYESAIHEAICSAIEIQSLLANYKTNDDIVLNIKLAIAHGSYTFHVVGEKNYKNIITVGPAIKDVNKVEKNCEAGHTVVSPETWKLLKHSNYDYEEASTKGYVNIKRVISNKNIHRYYKARIKSNKIEYRILSRQPEYEKIKSLVMEYLKFLKRCEYLTDYKAQIEETSDAKITAIDSNPIIKLRYCFGRSFEKNEIKMLKTFIIKSIIQKINDDQPFQYLSELRCVTILFLNLDLSFDTPFDESSKDVKPYQSIFLKINNTVNIFAGVLTKIVAFDKGCSFLCVFGLPGMTHENDAHHALACAQNLFYALEKFEFVRNVSIGITTGLTFTGVVGHPFRCEYTVIGTKVNLAARLMTNYSGMITCDHETYKNSRLPSSYFQIMPSKVLRGIDIDKVGVIRKYNEKINDGLCDIETFEYPIIGRKAELDLMYSNLSYLLMKQKSKISGDKRNFFVVYGENGIGKTRFLDALIQHIENVFQCMVITLKAKIDDCRSNYNTISKIIMAALKLNTLTTNEIENCLSKLHEGTKKQEYLFLFNDYYNTNFLKPAIYNSLTSQKSDDMLRRLFFNTLKKIRKMEISKRNSIYQSCFVVIDDAHNCDLYSWRSFLDFKNADKIIFLFSVRTPFNFAQPNNYIKQLFEDQKVLKIELKGLETAYLTTVACQLLEVVKIPIILNRILTEKSLGIPAWCEQLLRELYLNKHIEVVELESLDFKERKSYVDGLKPFLDKNKSSAIRNPNDNDTLSNLIRRKPLNENNLMVCKVLNIAQLKSMNFPEGMHGQILARIDRLHEDDALVVKAASLLGIVFLRKMLDHVLKSTLTPERLNISIQRLLHQDLLKCGSAPSNGRDGFLNDQKELNLLDSNSLICYCFPILPKPLSAEELECKILDNGNIKCRLLCFTNHLMQEVTEKLFTDEVAREIHLRAVQFLENEKWMCKACGGNNLALGLGNDKFIYLKTSFQMNLADIVNLVLEKLSKTKSKTILTEPVSFTSSHNTLSSKNYYLVCKNDAQSQIWSDDSTGNISVLSIRQPSLVILNKTPDDSDNDDNSTNSNIEINLEHFNEFTPDSSLSSTSGNLDLVDLNDDSFKGIKGSASPIRKLSEAIKYSSGDLQGTICKTATDQRANSIKYRSIWESIIKKVIEESKNGNLGKIKRLNSIENYIPNEESSKNISNKLDTLLKNSFKDMWLHFFSGIVEERQVQDLFPLHMIELDFMDNPDKDRNRFKPIEFLTFDFLHLNQKRNFRAYRKLSLTTNRNHNQRNDLCDNRSFSETSNFKGYLILPNKSAEDKIMPIKIMQVNQENIDSPESIQNLNMADCSCHLILSSILPHLIKHLHALDDAAREYFFMIEFASCLLSQKQTSTAIEILNQAESLYSLLKKGSNKNFDSKSDEITRFYNLIGLAYYQQHDYDKSLCAFKKALKCIDPTKKTSITMYIGAKIRHSLYVKNWKNATSDRLTQSQFRQFEEVSFSYTYMYQIYKLNNNFEKCLKIAYKHAELAEYMKTDLKVISIAYYELVEQFALRSDFKLCYKYIKRAVKISKNLLSDAYDFQSLGSIYYYAFTISFYNGKLDNALNYGTTSKMLFSYIHDNDSLLKIFPELILCALIIFKRSSIVLELKKEYENVVNKTNQLINLAWLDCLNIEIALVDDNFIENNDGHIKKLEKKLKDSILKSEPLLSFCFNCILVQWYIRNKSLNNANICYQAAIMSKSQIKKNSFLFAYGILKLIECQLVLYSSFQSIYSIKSINNLKINPHLLVNQKSNIFKPFKTLKPRLLLYRAYYKILTRESDGKVKTCLKSAIELAEKMNLHHELKLIQKSQQMWFPSYIKTTILNIFKKQKTKLISNVDDLNLFTLSLPNSGNIAPKKLNVCIIEDNDIAMWIKKTID